MSDAYPGRTLPPRPYPGLRPFAKSEWVIFFGRESMTQDVIARLVANRLVAVHGDSGCGKSSLIVAGVLPLLERDQARAGGRWRTCIMRPGGAPLWNLAEALASLNGGGPERAAELRRVLNRGAEAPKRLAKVLNCGVDDNVCILFDQFEELFEHARTHGPVEAELITGFLGGLVADRPKGLHAILTMRSDYLGQCAQYQGFAETVNATQYLVPRMERPALMRAIREPAELHGGSVSAEVAERLIADAGTGQDQLPLIQHGLMLLWQQRPASGELTFEDNPNKRDLAALLSNHASRLIEPGEEELAEAVFRALTGRNADGLAIRHRLTFAQLRAATGAETEPLQRLLSRFRAPDTSFIRPYGERPLEDGDEVDISHEAFIRNWEKIAAPIEGWLDREAEDGLIWTSLRMQAQSFAADKSKLLSAAVAEERGQWISSRTEAWAKRYGGDLASVKALIEDSRKEGNRRVRRDRLLLRAATAIALIMAVLSYFSYHQMNAAREARLMATEEAARAKTAARLAGMNESIGLAALSRSALIDGRPTDSVKLAIASWPRKGAEGGPKLRAAFDRAIEALTKHFQAKLLADHKGPVRWVAFSPDGGRVVTASDDGSAILWNAVSGKRIATLTGHAQYVWSAEFSPDGKSIVTASGDGTARIWDAEKGTSLILLNPGEDNERITSARFSPDDKRVVMASSNGTVRLWEAKGGFVAATLQVNQGEVAYATFSPDGTRIAAIADDNTVRLWDATGRAVATLRGHEGSVWHVSFTADSKRLATVSYDRTARLWNAGDGHPIVTLSGHRGSVQHANFSPDGARLVTAAADGTARLWDTNTGKEIAALYGHKDELYSAVFSRDGRRIVTASEDGTARLWDARSNVVIAELVGHEDRVFYAAFSPDGGMIATVSEDRTARLWDSTTDALGTVTLAGHEREVIAADFSPDGSRVVTASRDGTARIWNSKTGIETAELSGHQDAVSYAAFSPDATQIVTAGFDRTARIWNATTGAEVAKLEGHEGEITSAAFSPDGTRIVTASFDNTARLWDAASHVEIAKLSVHTAAVTSAIFSQDGNYVVTASEDWTAVVWDAKTGKLIRDLRGHSGPLRFATFSPDNKYILTSSDDNTARLWATDTAEMVTVYEGHDGDVYYAAFSRDGALVVTASQDKSVRIWNKRGGAEIFTLPVHESSVSTAVFSPDGTRIVTSSSDKTARIWEISRILKGEVFQIACHRLGNDTDLADVERRYHLARLPPICGEHAPLPVDLLNLQ